MSIRIIITFFILMLYTSIFAQSKQAQIEHIRSVFTTINTDTSLKKVLLDNDKLAKIEPDYQTTDNGSELTGFFKRDTLVKVIYFIGLSYCIQDFEFYFEKGKVVFIYEIQRNFAPDEKNQTLNHNKLIEVFQGRYYIDHNTVIQKIEKKINDGMFDNRVEALTIWKSDLPKYRKILSKAFAGK